MRRRRAHYRPWVTLALLCAVLAVPLALVLGMARALLHLDPLKRLRDTHKGALRTTESREASHVQAGLVSSGAAGSRDAAGTASTTEQLQKDNVPGANSSDGTMDDLAAHQPENERRALIEPFPDELFYHPPRSALIAAGKAVCCVANPA